MLLLPANQDASWGNSGALWRYCSHIPKSRLIRSGFFQLVNKHLGGMARKIGIRRIWVL